MTGACSPAEPGGGVVRERLREDIIIGRTEAVLSAGPELPWRDACYRAGRWLREADGLLIVAGPGLNRDCGLPSLHRDLACLEGLARRRAGGRFEHCGFYHAECFRIEPRLSWGFYLKWIRKSRAATPGEAHRLLREWADLPPKGAFVYSYLADDLFLRAGFDEDRLVEHLGTLNHLQCSEHCGRIWPLDDREWRTTQVAGDAGVEYLFGRQLDGQWLSSELPRCPGCGALARPAVLMIGDRGKPNPRFRRQQQQYRDWMRRVRNLVIIEIGHRRGYSPMQQLSERCNWRGKLIRIDAETPGRSCRNRVVIDHEDTREVLRHIEAYRLL